MCVTHGIKCDGSSQLKIFPRQTNTIQTTVALIALICGVVSSGASQVQGYQSRDRREGEMTVAQLMEKASEWSRILGFASWRAQDASYRYASKHNEMTIASPSGFSLVLNSVNGDLRLVTNGLRRGHRHAWSGTERGRKFSSVESEEAYAISILHALEPASVSWRTTFVSKIDGYRDWEGSDSCGYFSIMARGTAGQLLTIDFDSKDGQVLGLGWLHGKPKK